jgi:hypothetical protein
MGMWVNRHGKGKRSRSINVLMGFIHRVHIQWISLPSLEAEPHQNIATVVICISMSFYPLSDAFFRDTIEEVYNRDASLSIYQKKKRNLATSVCGLQCPTVIRSIAATRVHYD